MKRREISVNGAVCRQIIILGEVSTNQAETLEKVSNIIAKYSGWLKSKGIDIKNARNDDEKKQVLGQAFIRKVRKSLKPSKEHKELLKKYE